MKQSHTRVIMGQFPNREAADSGAATMRMAASARQIAVYGAAMVLQDARRQVSISPLIEFGAGQVSLLLRALRIYNSGLILAIRTTGALINGVTGMAINGAVRVINIATWHFRPDWRTRGAQPHSSARPSIVRPGAAPGRSSDCRHC